MYNNNGFSSGGFMGGQGTGGFGFQGGMGQPGMGYPQQGFPQQGFQQQGFPQQGFPQQGFPQQGFPQQGIPQQGFPQQGIPQQGIPQQGFPQQGFPQQGFPQQDFSKQGFPQQSYPQQGMTQPMPGMQQQPMPGMQQQPMPGMQQQPMPGMQQQPMPGMQQQPMPGMQQPIPVKQQAMPAMKPSQVLNYKPEQDCEALRKAMKGLGTDEDTIIKIICNRTNHQRQQIKLLYKTSYGKDLMKELKSELSGKLEDVVLGMFDTPSEYDANCLYKAMKGMGTDEDTLIEIIGTRNNRQLAQIKIDFQKLYGKDLIKFVESETSGRFKKLLVSLLQGNRNENMNADPNQCLKWAQEIYQAGEGKWGTDEAIFNKIFALRSPQELAMISSSYEQVSKRSLIKGVESEFSGDIKKLLLTVINGIMNPSEYFAKRVHDAVAGLGTNDKVLIRVLISRDEIDMPQIKANYQRLYGKDMMQAIRSDTSGDYRKILIELAGH